MAYTRYYVEVETQVVVRALDNDTFVADFITESRCVVDGEENSLFESVDSAVKDAAEKAKSFTRAAVANEQIRLR